MRFALLLFAYSVPIWWIGAAMPRELRPGLPLGAAFLVFCPFAAAATLVYSESGFAGVRSLLARALDFSRVRRRLWFAPALLLMPATMLAAAGIARTTAHLSAPRGSLAVSLGAALAFFVAATAEELGWSGYATDRMQTRWRALDTALIVGACWGIWHVPALMQAHRSPTWMCWWLLYTVAGRVLIVWIYNNTFHSLFAAAVYHAMSNVSIYLFPGTDVSFDPRIVGSMVAAIAVVVTLVWGPRTLAGSAQTHHMEIAHDCTT